MSEMVAAMSDEETRDIVNKLAAFQEVDSSVKCNFDGKSKLM